MRFARPCVPLLLLAAASCAPQPPMAEPAAVAVAPVPQQAAPMIRRASARAQSCEVGRIGRYRSGAGTISPMTVSNEGGWCSHGFTNEGRPFSSGSILTPPEHGEARTRNQSRRTVLEYRPNPGYVGTDRFVATLEPHGGTYIIEVTVKP